MTREENAALVLQPVLEAEGGIKDIGDGKGLTRFGQTPGWLVRFGLKPPATREEALANYLTFLVRTRLIGICDQADLLAHAAIDWCINSDHSVGIAGLQVALGVQDDGILGPETQAAIDTCDRPRIAARVVAGHARYYGQIITGNPVHNARWAKGWMNRLARQIEALAG